MSNIRFITCASYYGTGSSAITDLVSEYDNVYDFSDEEFRFIQDPDGISDLEFNLIECFNRHNSGHSLKRFKKLVDFYSGNIFGKKYSAFFGDDWIKYSYRYIDELTEFKYHGWWQYDLYDRGPWFYFRKRIVNKLLHKTVWKRQPERVYNSMRKEVTYCSHPTEDKFLECTRRYLNDLFSSVLPSERDTIMVDQLLPPMNLKRYLRYFDDIQVIVVDRDPRDVFVLDKYVWKDGILPSDVEIFCKWYRYTRSHRIYEDMNTEHTKFIQFEDLVYKYDDKISEIEKWLMLDGKKHSRKKEKFNPSRSIHNTQVWKKIQESDDEIRYIENELREYLYEFPEI